MEISNKIDATKLSATNAKKQTKTESITFSGNETVSSSSAIESIAKAKISLDGAYSKPISYEEKIKLLKEKKISENDFDIFLSQNDEIFKEMLEYLNFGVGTDALRSIYTSPWGSESTKKAADLAKYNKILNFMLY